MPRTITIPDNEFERFLNSIINDNTIHIEQRHSPRAIWVMHKKNQALYTAVEHGKINTLKYLLELVGIFKQKVILDERYDLLYFASKKNNIECFEYLLEVMFSFADRKHFRLNAGFEIYQEAVRENNYDVVRVLFNAESENVGEYLSRHYLDNLIHALEYPSGHMFKFLLHAADDVQEILNYQNYLMIEMILSTSHPVALHALHEKFPGFLLQLPDEKFLRLAHQITTHHSYVMLDTFLKILELKGLQRLNKLMTCDIIHELCHVKRFDVIEKLLWGAGDFKTFRKVFRNICSFDSEEAREFVSKYQILYQCMKYADGILRHKPQDPIFLMPMIARYQLKMRAKYIGFLIGILKELAHPFTTTLLLQKQLPDLLDKFVHKNQNSIIHHIHDLVPVIAGVMSQEYAKIKSQLPDLHYLESNSALQSYETFLKYLQFFDPLLDYAFPIQTPSAKFNDFVHQYMGFEATIASYNSLMRCRYLFINSNINLHLVLEILMMMCNENLENYQALVKYSPQSHWTVMDMGHPQDESEEYDYIFMEISPAEWVLAYAHVGLTCNPLMLKYLEHWIDTEQPQKLVIDVREDAQLLTY